MIAVDTQILVYAHRRDSAWHERARDLILDLAERGARWGTPLHCLVEFYATVTGKYRPPSTIEQAIDQIEAWLESPGFAVLADGAHTWSASRDLLRAGKIVGAGVYDARIAAVCLQHTVTELWTNDGGFLAFPALRVRNPLVDIHPTRAGEARAATHQTRTNDKRSRPHSASAKARSGQTRRGTTRR